MSKIISTTITNPNSKEDACALVQVTGQELYYLLRPIEIIGKYTISFWVKAQANETIVVHYGEQTKEVAVNTEWQRVIFPFNAEHIDNVMIQFTTGNYYVYNTKLESGNFATDYSESPEDMEKQLADIEKIMNTQYSEVVQLLDAYKVEVGQTYATQDSVNDKVSKLTVDLDGFKTEVKDTYTTQSDFQAQIDNLQQQIDGAVETFSGYDVPTLENKPAVEWTTDAIKDTHVGDLYVVSSENTEYGGFYYRFEKTNGTYQWTLLADSEVTKALEEARKANEKAEAAQEAINALTNNLATNYSTTVQMESAINQSASSILQEVSGTYATTESVNASLELKVGVNDNDKIVSMINASADEVQIKANKIDLIGQVTADMLNVKDLSAIGATIGGFNISSNSLYIKPLAQLRQFDLGWEHNGTLGNYGAVNWASHQRLVTGALTTELNPFGLGFSIDGPSDYYRVEYCVNGVGITDDDTVAYGSADKIIKFSKDNVWIDKLSVESIACKETIIASNVEGGMIVGGNITTKSGISLANVNSQLPKSMSVDATINVTANSYAYKDITWSLPEGKTFLGLSHVITDRGGVWSSLASVSHQTITNSGCRLIVAANVAGNYTVRTYVYYK